MTGIVYDASSKQRKKFKSLNDGLYCGPVLLPDLCGILSQFRMHNVAVVADVEKAFLQLGLHNQDRDVAEKCNERGSKGEL